MKHFYTVHRFWVEGDGDYVDMPIMSFAKREDAETFCKERGKFSVHCCGAVFTAKYQIVKQTFSSEFKEIDWHSVKIKVK